MDFEDGTEILSKLGILHSTDQCPKKESPTSAPTAPRNIGKDSKRTAQESEEVTLPIPTLNRRLRVLLFLSQLILFFAQGFSFYGSQSEAFKYHGVIGSISFIVGLLAARKFIHFWKVWSVNLAISLILAVFSLINTSFIPHRQSILGYAIETFLIGILIYVSLAFWFIYSRSSFAKIILITSFLYVGAFTQAILFEDGVSEPLRMSPTVIDSFVNGTSKKPEIAQGIASVDTKTKENEIMREQLYLSSADSSYLSNTPSSAKLQTSVFNISQPSTMFFGLKTVLFCCIFLMNLLLSYRSKLANVAQQLSALKDAGNCVPSTGLRLRYSLYIMMQETARVVLIYSLASSYNSNLMVYFALAAGTFLALIVNVSHQCFIHSAKIVVMLFFLATCVASIFYPTQFVVFMIFLLLGPQKLMSMLQIEITVKLRVSTALDIFLIPTAFGSFFGYLLMALLTGSKLLCILLASVVLVVFILLQRSISRNTRLAEILQYTGELDTNGDYVALLEQDFSSDSENGDFEEV